MIRTATAVALALAGGAVRLSAQHASVFSTSRHIAWARPLDVTLDFSGGTLTLLPAPAGELYALRLQYDADVVAPVQEFDSLAGTLRLGVTTSGAMAVAAGAKGQRDEMARVELSRNVPLALTMRLAGTDAAVDLGGFALRALDVRSGAGESIVDFSTATSGTCDHAAFTIGAAQLAVHHLANAGCAAISVSGGAGGTTLDFSGTWRRNPVVSVDLAMGHLRLAVPRGTGLRIAGSRFLAPLDKAGLIAQAGGWATPGYDAAPRQIDVHVDASLAGIDVEWQ